MFDTSVVRSRAVAAPKFGLFAVSVAIHSGAIVAAIALTLASTQLPTRAPNQMEIYRPVVIPTVPPAYGHPPGVKPRPAGPTVAKLQPAVQTAPNQIPDQTPTIAGPTSVATSPDAVGEPADGPIGVPWGDPDSVNPLDATPQPLPHPSADITYTPGGEISKARVLRRVEPLYPPIMVKNRIPALVTVHCTVDRYGSIRDAQIIRSSFPPFNEAVLDAVRQWTFAPGTRRGQPVDTYFELTVKFVVQ